MRFKSLVAIGFIGSFALGGGQQKPSTPSKLPVDLLMSNARCNITIIEEKGDKMMGYFKNAMVEKVPRKETFVGTLLSLKGSRLLKVERATKTATGQNFVSRKHFTWDGEVSRMTWTAFTSGNLTDRQQEQFRKFDPTEDPAEMTYRFMGKSTKELVDQKIATTYCDGDLAVFEGVVNKLRFKLWTNPKHLHLIERAEFALSVNGYHSKFSIRSPQEVNGVWLPKAMVTEDYSDRRGPQQWLNRRTVKFDNWKFGTVKKSDFKLQASFTNLKTP